MEVIEHQTLLQLVAVEEAQEIASLLGCELHVKRVFSLKTVGSIKLIASTTTATNPNCQADRTPLPVSPPRLDDFRDGHDFKPLW